MDALFSIHRSFADHLPKRNENSEHKEKAMLQGSILNGVSLLAIMSVMTGNPGAVRAWHRCACDDLGYYGGRGYMGHGYMVGVGCFGGGWKGGGYLGSGYVGYSTSGLGYKVNNA